MAVVDRLKVFLMNITQECINCPGTIIVTPHSKRWFKHQGIKVS